MVIWANLTARDTNLLYNGTYNLYRCTICTCNVRNMPKNLSELHICITIQPRCETRIQLNARGKCYINKHSRGVYCCCALLVTSCFVLQDRSFKVSNKFSRFTYWNLENVPSLNDKLKKAMQWINVSSAVSLSVRLYPNLAGIKL